MNIHFIYKKLEVDYNFKFLNFSGTKVMKNAEKWTLFYKKHFEPQWGYTLFFIRNRFLRNWY